MKKYLLFITLCLIITNVYSQNRGIKYEQLNPSVADSICANCVVEPCDPVRVFGVQSPNGLEISDPADNTQWQAWIDDYNSVNECPEKTSFIFEGLCRVRDRIVTLRFTPRPITEGVVNFTTPNGSQSFTFPVAQLEMCFQENESGSSTPTCDAMQLQINNDIEPFGLSINNFFVGQSETQSAATSYSLTFFLNSTGFLSADPIDINGQTINCNVQPDYFVYQSETTESTLVEYPLTSIDVTPCIVKNQPVTFSTTVQGAICEIAEYVDTNTDDIEECCPCANVSLSDLGVSDFSDFSEVDAAAQTYISSNRCGAGTNFIGCESQDFVFNIVNIDQNFFPLVEVSNFETLDFSNGNINAEVWQGGVYMNDIIIISQNASDQYTVSGTVDDNADQIRVSILSDDCYVYQSDLNDELILIEQPNTVSGGTGPQGPAGSDGTNGINCWDTNENGVNDISEDVNSDGVFDAMDCQGNDGTNGLDGSNGINCWDTNGNGVNDVSEDTNSDGVFDALDCQGSGTTPVTSSFDLIDSGVGANNTMTSTSSQTIDIGTDNINVKNGLHVLDTDGIGLGGVLDRHTEIELDGNDFEIFYHDGTRERLKFFMNYVNPTVQNILMSSTNNAGDGFGDFILDSNGVAIRGFANSGAISSQVVTKANTKEVILVVNDFAETAEISIEPSTVSTSELGIYLKTREEANLNTQNGQVLTRVEANGEAEWKNPVHLIPIDEFLANQVVTDRTGIVPYLVHTYQSDLNYEIISAEVCVESGTGSTNVEILHNGSLVFGGPQTVTAGSCIQLTGGTTNVAPNGLVRIRTSGTTGAPMGLYTNILMQ